MHYHRDWKHKGEHMEQWIDDIENMEPLTVMRIGRICNQRQPWSLPKCMSLKSNSIGDEHLMKL